MAGGLFIGGFARAASVPLIGTDKHMANLLQPFCGRQLAGCRGSDAETDTTQTADGTGP